MKIKIISYCLLIFISAYAGVMFSGCNFESEKIILPPEKPEIRPEPKTADKSKKLTLMIYMAADNDLEPYAIQNLKAMEHADFSEINVLVLLDRSEGYDETNGNWTDTRLFKVGHDSTTGNYIISERLNCPELGLASQSETELDMGNYYVLQSFIEFSKKEYRAQNYALIIWGHGTGWKAFSIDDKTGTYMSVFDMGRAVKNQGLSVIGFDTCFACVIENLYELRDSSEYSVASAGVSPGGGWDYKGLLENLSSNNLNSQTIALTMKDSSAVNITVIKNSKLSEVFTGIEDFSNVLSSTITDSVSRNSVFTNLTQVKSYSYTQYPCDMYIDVFSMAESYAGSSNPALAEKAANLIESLNESYIKSNNEKPEIGIHFISKTALNTYSTSHSMDYLRNENIQGQCSFIKESKWWVPEGNSSSGSLLDKLFYTTY